MQLLALETSTNLGSCALWRDGACAERFCPDGVLHSETLLPLVRNLLTDAGVSLSQLDGIAFGAGPGAFTGLRVACGVAQGLAVGAGLPVVPVGSLDALAWASGTERCLVLLDARMNEIYSGCFERGDHGLRLIGALGLSSPEALEWPQTGRYVVVGNALRAYPQLAQRAGQLGMATQAELMPRAADIAALAALKMQAGEACDPALAVPHYVRDKVAKTVLERLTEGGKA